MLFDSLSALGSLIRPQNSPDYDRIIMNAQRQHYRNATQFKMTNADRQRLLRDMQNAYPTDWAAVGRRKLTGEYEDRAQAQRAEAEKHNKRARNPFFRLKEFCRKEIADIINDIERAFD